MNWLTPVILSGSHCTLKPLLIEHYEALIEAAKDGELWNIRYAGVPDPGNMKNEIIKRLDLQEKGVMLPFVVIHNDTQKVTGMTSFCHIEQVNKRINIGFTWYAKSHHRTALNTDCKLTLLTYAFEKLNCIAVSFRVDYLNRPSRQAVERLGAKYEGMIRNYDIRSDGGLRDMCFYSILPHEWLNIKYNLQSMLKKTYPKIGHQLD